MLTMWHCPHSPTAHHCCSNWSISPARKAHSNKPTMMGLMLRAHARTDRQTERCTNRRTLYHFIVPAPHTTWVVPITWTNSSSKRKLTSEWAGSQDWLPKPVPLHTVWSTEMSKDRTMPRRCHWAILTSSLEVMPTALQDHPLPSDWTEKTLGWQTRKAAWLTKQWTSPALLQTWNEQQ